MSAGGYFSEGHRLCVSGLYFASCLDFSISIFFVNVRGSVQNKKDCTDGHE